ncbi:uncharacterized protein [Dysidea avara]|uniref:uncharacterized protein isoform X1 n=1 Tax=Dysidea avara TaxID=196820 RepID=UPI0033340E80
MIQDTSTKKGKSCSKILNSEDESPPPKRKKISKEYRLQRISELQDKIKDLEDRIGYKIKRREAASNNRLYKDCDELTEQISDLKSQKRQLSIELVALNQKQKMSLWYDSNRKKTTSGICRDLSKTAQATRSKSSSVSTSQSSSESCTSSVSSKSTASLSILADDSETSGRDTVILCDDEDTSLKHTGKPVTLRREEIPDEDITSDITSAAEMQHF